MSASDSEEIICQVPKSQNKEEATIGEPHQQATKN